jgi:hypothetical protein
LAPRFHEKRQIGAIIKLRGGINSSTMRIRLRKRKPIRATWLGFYEALRYRTHQGRK